MLNIYVKIKQLRQIKVKEKLNCGDIYWASDILLGMHLLEMTLKELIFKLISLDSQVPILQRCW